MPVAIESNFDVVVAAIMFLQEIADGVAEVAFDFENQAGGSVVGVVRLPGEELIGEGLHAKRRFCRFPRLRRRRGR